MKKNVLFLFLTFFSVSIFGQSRMVEISERINKTYEFTNSVVNPVVAPSASSSAPTIIWSDDCSDPATWVFTNTSTQGFDWEWTQDPNAIPPNSNGPMTSSTASNGYMLINSDANGSPTSQDLDGTFIIAEFTNANPVDCSNYPYVKLVFEHNYRWWQDTRGVRVSGDNGATWTDFEITNLQGYPNLQNSGTPEVTTYDISSIAGGQSQVLVQFYYNDNDYWAWYWAVDDVSIQKLEDNDIDIQDEVIGGWWIDYETAGGIGQDYTFYPLTQAAAQPYAFESVIKNAGIATQDVVMHATVTEDASGSIVYTGTSNTITLAASEQDTFGTTTQFSPTNGGAYTIEIWGEADSAGLGVVSTLTDITTKNTTLTDFIYGKDNDLQEGFWRLSRTTGMSTTQTPGAFEIGADYDIYTPATLYSVDAYMTEESVAGAKVYAMLYEVDITGAMDPVYLSQSDDFILPVIPSGGGWINIPFLSPQTLTPTSGYSYCIAIGGYMHPTDSACIATSGTGTASADRMFDKNDWYQNGAPSWYTIADIPMLRMNFDPSTFMNSNEISSFMSISPNPTTGLLNVKVDQASSYTINIVNLLGQVVYEEEMTNLSKVIDISSFDKGVYTIELSDNKETIAKKIVLE